MHRQIPMKRIQQEMKDLQKNKSHMYSAGPVDSELFHWHFTIRGPPDTCFAQGMYHGRIEFSYEYPIKPPDIYFLTPNGRYEINTKLCLSITTYHPEEWNPAWTARSILEGLISTLPDKDDKMMGLGGLKIYSEDQLRAMAQRSRSWVCEKCGPIAAQLSEEVSAAAASAQQSAAEQQQEEQKADAPHSEISQATLQATAETEKIQAKIDSGRQEAQQLSVLQLHKSVSSLLHMHSTQALSHEKAPKSNKQSSSATQNHISIQKVFENLTEYETVVESIRFIAHPSKLDRLQRQQQEKNDNKESDKQQSEQHAEPQQDQIDSINEMRKKMYSKKNILDVLIFITAIVTIFYFIKQIME